MRAMLMVVVGVLGALWLGCATDERKGETNSDEEAAAMKRPMMFNEAKLPAGFPPPGPVGAVIVKEYPAYRLARVAASEVRGGQDDMFRPLFNHIKRNDIPMTAPVEMTYDKDAGRGTAASSMGFLYGQPTWGEIGRDAADGRVEVIDIPAMTVASVGVRGAYNARQLDEALNMLGDWIGAHAGEYRLVGPARYMAYNSPFVPNFLKYGEVQLPIEPVATAAAGG